MIPSFLPPLDISAFAPAHARPEDARTADASKITREKSGDVTTHDFAKRIAKAEQKSFVKSARRMVKDALHDFRHGAREMLSDLGFESKTIGKMVDGLIKPIREALRSGADFAASVLVAAVSQRTVATGAGAAGSFNLAIQSLDITVNHSTGTVEIDVANVEIESRFAVSFDGGGPRLFDADDGDDDGFALSDMLGDVEDFLESAEIGLEQPDETAPQPGATVVEAVRSAQAAHARIVVQAFEQFLNESGEQISRLRLDALIPLLLNAADAPAEPAPNETVSPGTVIEV